eukprot:4361381-Prymnesium_polylepis.1
MAWPVRGEQVRWPWRPASPRLRASDVSPGRTHGHAAARVSSCLLPTSVGRAHSRRMDARLPKY